MRNLSKEVILRIDGMKQIIEIYGDDREVNQIDNDHVLYDTMCQILQNGSEYILHGVMLILEIVHQVIKV